MYQLTEKQIDFIIDDIRARGVEMESLQNDLLDHLCCLVEQKLEASGDFEQFYYSIIQTFYIKELKEIESETISLLKNKSYYAMKKVMIASGIISASLLTMGIILKFLHMPGAGFGLVTGIVSFSFVFLPLMYILKIKEKQQTKDKVLLALGSVVTIMISMAILFKIMHWPHANMMGLTSVGILFLLYLPINFVTGIRHPDTKVNTIVSSILLVAGCGLFLSLARSPQGSRLQYIKDTSYVVRNEQLFRNEQQQLINDFRNKNAPIGMMKSGEKIISLCDAIKSYIIEKETGFQTLEPDFEKREAWLGETYVADFFHEGSQGYVQYLSLQDEIKAYNKSIADITEKKRKTIPENSILLMENNERVTGALNSLIQLQMFVLQNERELISGI